MSGPVWTYSEGELGRIEMVRVLIEAAYREHPTGCGASFGEILCHEIHTRGQTFTALADKWGISLPTLGELIHDHCCRLQPLPKVRHEEERR